MKGVSMPKPRVDWQQFDHLFQTQTEAFVAKHIPCSWAAAYRRRTKLGLPRITLRRAKWTADDEALFAQGVLRCRACCATKSILNFSKNKKATKGLRVICSLCHNRQTCQRRRLIKTKWLNAMGGCKCRICGFDNSLAALQFHHVEGKDKNPCQMMYSKHADEIIRSELEKCCVVCSNCHDALHAHEIEPEFLKSETHIGYFVKEKK